MQKATHRELVLWLEKAVDDLRHIEDAARHCIEEHADQSGYEKFMCRKALLLALLIEQGQKFIQEFPEVMEEIRRFSANAERALSLGSVFFMSALLYPEDHSPGQDNDLEILLKSIRDAN